MNGWENWALGALLVILAIAWMTVLAGLWWGTGNGGDDEETSTVEAQAPPDRTDT